MEEQHISCEQPLNQEPKSQYVLDSAAFAAAIQQQQQRQQQLGSSSA